MKNIIFSFHSTKEGFKGVVKSERTLYLTGFHSTKEGFKAAPTAYAVFSFAFCFHSTKEGFKVGRLKNTIGLGNEFPFH
mgnify:CR=1 FL=1